MGEFVEEGEGRATLGTQLLRQIQDLRYPLLIRKRWKGNLCFFNNALTDVRLDAYQAQEIREAYYKAVEGLRSLADALEIADAQQTVSAGPLLTEHMIAIQALDAMKPSGLGPIL